MPLLCLSLQARKMQIPVLDIGPMHECHAVAYWKSGRFHVAATLRRLHDGGLSLTGITVTSVICIDHLLKCENQANG